MRDKIRTKLRDKKNADLKRATVAAYKLGKGCVDCGYKENAMALEFDHCDNSGKPYSGKQRTVASLMYNSWDVIWTEIAKCEIVCANCHAIRTFTRRK